MPPAAANWNSAQSSTSDPLAKTGDLPSSTATRVCPRRICVTKHSGLVVSGEVIPQHLLVAWFECGQAETMSVARPSGMFRTPTSLLFCVSGRRFCGMKLVKVFYEHASRSPAWFLYTPPKAVLCNVPDRNRVDHLDPCR